MHGFFEVYGASPFMWLNTIVSIFAIGIIAYRLITLMRYQVNGGKFMQNVEKYVLSNDLNQAINHCSTSSAPLSAVVKSGLIKANQGPMAVSMGLDEATLQVTPKVEKGVNALWSIANIATLVGLIGTIWGLILSFSGLSVATPEQRAQLLGAGIAEALYNTAFGLLIAVTCIFAHMILSGIAKGILSEIDYSSSRLENLLMLRNEGGR
ncbi:MAG: MotA/TolQ/ExbB proton channel family protein [Bdellovibrionota bacterium]